MRTFSITLTFLIFLLLALVPVLAQEGPDEVEPNDSRALADSIDGLTIDGEIGRHEDEDDWFVLEGQEGYNPRITLIYDVEECDIDLEVFSDEDLVGSLTSTDSPDRDTFDVAGVCYLHVYVYEGRGEYTIEIEPGDRDRGRDRDPGHRRPGQCEGPDEVEPNDGRRDADSIDALTIEGYACEDEDDWFVLEGQEGYRPLITISYDEDECDIDVDVYSDHDEAGSLTGTSSPDSGEFDMPGECYLRVYAFEGEGDYTIEIERQEGDEECQGPDEVESNDTRAIADSIEDLTFEGYACEGEDDWFVLQGQEGTRPEITLRYDEDECDIDLEVYSGEELIGSLTDADSPDRDTFRIPDVCYIHVWAYEDEGSYEVEIEP